MIHWRRKYCTNFAKKNIFYTNLYSKYVYVVTLTKYTIDIFIDWLLL